MRPTTEDEIVPDVISSSHDAVDARPLVADAVPWLARQMATDARCVDVTPRETVSAERISRAGDSVGASSDPTGQNPTGQDSRDHDPTGHDPTASRADRPTTTRASTTRASTIRPTTTRPDPTGGVHDVAPTMGVPRKGTRSAPSHAARVVPILARGIERRDRSVTNSHARRSHPPGPGRWS